MRPINWSFIGEWVFIFSFCILYALIANVESRIHPPIESKAHSVRKRVDFEVHRLTAKHYCEDQAIRYSLQGSGLIWVWYENEVEHEYWCGALDPDTLTYERLRELAPHIEVLNSNRKIKEGEHE